MTVQPKLAGISQILYDDDDLSHFLPRLESGRGC